MVTPAAVGTAPISSSRSHEGLASDLRSRPRNRLMVLRSPTSRTLPERHQARHGTRWRSKDEVVDSKAVPPPRVGTFGGRWSRPPRVATPIGGLNFLCNYEVTAFSI